MRAMSVPDTNQAQWLGQHLVSAATLRPVSPRAVRSIEADRARFAENKAISNTGIVGSDVKL